jgi:hypothetical protein
VVEPIEDRVLKLEERQTRFGEDIHRLSTTVASIEEKVGRFNDKLAARPSWAVCTIIAGLSFSTAALGSTLLTLLVQTGG